MYDIEKDEFSPPSAGVTAEILEYVAEHRSSTEPFDYAVAGTHTPGENITEWLAEFEDVGATWFRDTWIPEMGTEHEAWMASVLEGPPVR